uniref:Uncharacterized protein n=1 Tax=Fagus sylvatica TaxID=28930 RepID=A0A2N9HJS9_FAGSY
MKTQSTLHPNPPLAASSVNKAADDDEDKSAIRSLRKRVLDKLNAHQLLSE